MIRALAPDRADQALKNTLSGLYRRVDPMSRILYHVVVFGVPLERQAHCEKKYSDPG